MRRLIVIFAVLFVSFFASGTAHAAYVGVGEIVGTWTHVWWEGGDYLCRGGECEEL